MRFLNTELNTETFKLEDHLTKRPEKNFSYITSNGRLKDRDFYGQFAHRKPELPKKKIHPKLQEHINRGTATKVIYRYYEELDYNVTLPIAGIIFEDLAQDIAEANGPPSEGNPTEKPPMPRKPLKIVKHRKSARNSKSPDLPLKDAELHSKSNEPEPCPFALAELFPDRKRSERRPFEKAFDYKNIQLAHKKGEQVSNKNQEETFHARPSIQLPIPDHVKAILVDDWENVTKNQQLVPLPSAHPVGEILDDYYKFENPRRVEGSSHADILEEVIAGLKDYFEKCLGRVLLYRYDQISLLGIHLTWLVGLSVLNTQMFATNGLVVKVHWRARLLLRLMVPNTCVVFLVGQSSMLQVVILILYSISSRADRPNQHGPTIC